MNNIGLDELRYFCHLANDFTNRLVTLFLHVNNSSGIPPEGLTWNICLLSCDNVLPRLRYICVDVEIIYSKKIYYYVKKKWFYK